MKEMTKRERVERTLALQETDRVPVYDLLRCDAAFEHYSGRKIPPLAEDKQTLAELDGIVGAAVGNMLDMTRDVGFGPVTAKETTDGFGFVRRSDPHEKTSWIAHKPFDDEAGAIVYLEKYLDALRNDLKAKQNSDPVAARDAHHRQFMAIQSRIGDTVNLLGNWGTGLDEIRERLGIEMFAYVDADQPGLVSEILETSTRIRVDRIHVVADRQLSPCVLTFGDIACKGRLLHSPEWLRREFFPRLKRLNDAWHEHGLKCLFHSDGLLMEVMDDLIAAGIDGLNPIETVAGMNLAEVKAKYGRKIFLAGGIDMSQLLSNGTPEEVREVCRDAIRTAYPGYFIGSTTEADNSSALNNLIAMIDTAHNTKP